MTFAAVTKTIKSMYSSSDFERLFIRYKAEAMPQGESIHDFCLKNKVPYNLFYKWYKDTRHQIIPDRWKDNTARSILPTFRKTGGYGITTGENYNRHP